MNTIPLFELKKVQTNFPAVKIETPKEGADFIKNFYGDDIEIFESAFILLLNNNNVTIGYAKIGQGGIVGAVVDIRLICKYAIESLCTGVVLAHNHPSGNLNPSQADRDLTKRLEGALDVFSIRLTDSLILTKDSFYSICYS